MIPIVIKDEPRTGDELFQLAVAAGCKPKWYDGIFGWRWHCTCDGEPNHCSDQQCSMITVDSIKRYLKNAKDPNFGKPRIEPELEARRCEHGYIMWENSCTVCRFARKLVCE